MTEIEHRTETERIEGKSDKDSSQEKKKKD